jgi:hypothetical protein
MDIDAAHQARREKELKLKKQKELNEAIELLFALLLITATVVGIIWGTFEFIQYCQGGKCA